MTGAVQAALIAAEKTGRIPALDELGTPTDVSAEVVTLAQSVLAPLAANALAAAISQSPETWAETASAFAQSLGAQRSYLALADTIDALLDVPEAAAATARKLHDALLADHDLLVSEQPLLAAMRLEGALRVVLSGTVAPYLVLDRLGNASPDLPNDYLERLPRLIGIALDQWETDAALTTPLVATLQTLLGEGAAGPEAAYELACRQMRVALREPDPQAAVVAFAAARDSFGSAADLEEVRDDATAYANACAAVAAFGDGDMDRLRKAATSLRDVVSRRLAWHRRMHEPAWRQPRLDAEVAWLGLVIDLREAAEHLAEPSWLDSTATIGQLSRAYTAERATAPAPGLIALVRPTIENAVADNAILADQLERTIRADREGKSALPPGADLLLGAIREHRAQRRPHHRATDAEAHLRTSERIERLAPSLTRLGYDVAQAVASQATDDRLAEVGSLFAALTASGIEDHPALGRMRARIVDGLSRNPAFQGDTRAWVIALLDVTLAFLFDRYDGGGHSRGSGQQNIYRQLLKDESPPLEWDLQREFYTWLATSSQFAGRARIEQSDIATGRADVLVRIGDIQIVTEVKRELSDATQTSLERQYGPQAASYSGSNVPFGQLLVLDLTDHASGVPPLPDLAWLVEHRARPDASPQHVVAVVVVGNRPSPSKLRSRPATAQED